MTACPQQHERSARLSGCFAPSDVEIGAFDATMVRTRAETVNAARASVTISAIRRQQAGQRDDGPPDGRASAEITAPARKASACRRSDGYRQTTTKPDHESRERVGA